MQRTLEHPSCGGAPFRPDGKEVMGNEIRIVKCTDPAVKPKCPGCSQPVEELLSVALGGGFLNQSNLVVCPHCHVILGYGKVNYL